MKLILSFHVKYILGVVADDIICLAKHKTVLRIYCTCYVKYFEISLTL